MAATISLILGLASGCQREFEIPDDERVAIERNGAALEASVTRARFKRANPLA